MKRTVAVVTVLAALTGASGYAAVAQWHDTKIKNQAAAQAVADADAAAAQAKADKVVADKAEARKTVYLTLRAQCEKGRQAYDALPPATKAKLAVPVCGTATDISTISQ